MNFRYNCKHINIGNNIWVKEPIIPVTLIGSSGISLNFTAILDSGSDLVLLPLEVAEELKLEYNKEDTQNAKTYSGNTIATTLSNIKIKIEKQREQPVVVQCRCAIWLDRNKQHEHIIFGSTFFEHFRILFDYPHNKFEIKK